MRGPAVARLLHCADHVRLIAYYYLRLVTVVLGADTLAGPALVHSLEKRGYVVIASCATAEAAEMLEKRSKGFVRALVLRPQDVCHRFRESYGRHTDHA